MRNIKVEFGQNTQGVAAVDREELKARSKIDGNEIDSMLSGMLDDFNFDNDMKLDNLME